MKITVIGGGYVGLTTGICLAYVGHDVCIVERDQAKIGLLLDGVLPIYEPGLDQVWHSCSERVVFRDHVSHEVANSDLIVIAVGTPSSSDGDVDLTDLFAAVRELRNELNPKKDYVVAIKSKFEWRQIEFCLTDTVVCLRAVRFSMRPIQSFCVRRLLYLICFILAE